MNVKSESQIYVDAEVLQVDTFYIMQRSRLLKKVNRLGYNKDAPIRIVLNKNLQEESKELIREIYETKINPLFEAINDKYVFEVVDAKDFKKTSKDKVIIYFEYKSELDSIWEPEAQAYYHAIDEQINPILTRAWVKLNADATFRTVMHEILHTFGLDDIYHFDYDYYGTFLNSASSPIPFYKENDIRLLAAMYYDGQDFDGMNEWIENYTKEYYCRLAEHFLDAEISYMDSERNHLTKEILPIEELSLPITLSGESSRVTIEIVLINGKYNCIQREKDSGELLFEQEGVYYFYGGKIFLGLIRTGTFGRLCVINFVIANTADGFTLCLAEQWFTAFFFAEIFYLTSV